MIIPAKSQFNWFSGFWQEDFQGFNQSEHVIGPGSHVEFPIYTKSGRGSIGLVVSDKKIFKVSTNQNTLLALVAMLNFRSTPNLVEDHPMNIYGKFGWNLFSGFREEELNVKS